MHTAKIHKTESTDFFNITLLLVLIVKMSKRKSNIVFRLCVIYLA